EAANPDDHVFEVTADYVNITGFTVVNGGILLETSSNNLIAENCIFGADGGLGIGLSNSSNNSISDNEIMVPAMTGYSIGIGLYNSSSNKVSRNRVMLFTMYPYVLVGSDISLENSSSNNIYLNDLSSVMSFNSTNIWNSPEEITYTYNGNTYTNYLGNYWSDYGIYLPAVGHNDPDDQWEDETLAYDENKNTYARVYLSGGRDSSWLELLVPAGKLTQGIRFWGSGGPLEVDIYYGGNWYCLRDWAWGISSAPANE
ncbi:MAG: right-handed parallel beta-helix repeat-containing protein, partial [Dehalococcoidia bacterium]|nr:right-handed parallel beta-helix repeat-containing protein [Dehalococcoidia bacterium]